MNASEVKQRLRDLGISPSKRLGQHFLTDGDVARSTVAEADIRPGDTVLEVGPGLGILTEVLLSEARHVVAVEKDPRLCDYLRRVFPDLDLIEGDVLHVEVPPFDRVVSNLPYEISSPFTFKLLDTSFKRAVLTYQKEFAERLVARPGSKDYSRLTVRVYYRCDARLLDTIPRDAFWPPPEVDSAVVMLDPRAPPFQVDLEAFRRVTDALFTHRRKKVVNALLSEWRALSPSKEDLREAVEATSFASKRAQEMTPEDMAELTNALTPKVKAQPPNLKASRGSDGT